MLPLPVAAAAAAAVAEAMYRGFYSVQFSAVQSASVRFGSISINSGQVRLAQIYPRACGRCMRYYEKYDAFFFFEREREDDGYLFALCLLACSLTLLASLAS